MNMHDGGCGDDGFIRNLCRRNGHRSIDLLPVTGASERARNYDIAEQG